jgi:hypothetical protein
MLYQSSLDFPGAEILTRKKGQQKTCVYVKQREVFIETAEDSFWLAGCWQEVAEHTDDLANG